MWRNDVAAQLRSEPHLVMSVCQKEKGWTDLTMKVPTFETDVAPLVVAALLSPSLQRTTSTVISNGTRHQKGQSGAAKKDGTV